MPNWTNDDGYSEFGKDDMDGPVTRPKSKKSISDVLPTDAEHEAEIDRLLASKVKRKKPRVGPAPGLSQWWTPEWIALRMARLLLLSLESIDDSTDRWVLEPAAGDGALIRGLAQALKERYARTDTFYVRALELDPFHCWKTSALSKSIPSRQLYVEEGDAVSILNSTPELRYDGAIMNPPFEGGLDREILAATMDRCDVVVCFMKVTGLCGQARHEKIWSRVENGEFGLETIAFFPARPKSDSGDVGSRESGTSPKSDYCVVKLVREYQGQTRVEWWTP